MPIVPEKLALFLAASLALTLTPGPAVLFIVARSMGQGRRAGLFSVLGIGLGNAIHATATALGLAALLASSSLAFALVRYLGAAYLVFLGARKFVGRAGPGLTPEASSPAAPDLSVLRQAFTVALLNPKTALFFLAFLPQFANPARGALPAQLLFLGVLFTVTALVTDAGYAVASDSLGRFMKSHPAFSSVERFLGGSIFIGLGLFAALSGSAEAPRT
jgi:threonine/homoserine/homoserine lactone efflux protein